MAENSAIEWCDHTFNPWVGCTKISPACGNCYAESWAKRAGSPELWTGERRRTTAANWRQPLKWNAKAEAEGRRYRVFCASLADVFDNQVPAEWRADLFRLIEATPSLDWLLLTKRPQNIRKMLPADWDEGFDYSNVWLGTTVANQEEADRNIPHLLGIACRVHFLSIEPILGAIDLTRIEGTYWTVNALTGVWTPKPGAIGDGPSDVGRIEWVITGGESGPKARPYHPDWFRSLRDQCAAAGVAYLHKQNGEWASVSEVPGPQTAFHTFDDHATVRRVGKKAAGRLLDGVQHDGMPA